MVLHQFAVHRLVNGNYRVVLLPQTADEKPVELDFDLIGILEFANKIKKMVEEFEQKHNPEK